MKDMYTAAAATGEIIYIISKHKKAYAYGHALLKVLEAAHLVHVREIIPAKEFEQELKRRVL